MERIDLGDVLIFSSLGYPILCSAVYYYNRSLVQYSFFFVFFSFQTHIRYMKPHLLFRVRPEECFEIGADLSRIVECRDQPNISIWADDNHTIRTNSVILVSITSLAATNVDIIDKNPTIISSGDISS